MTPFNPVATFVQEAEELLADIEQSALALRAGPDLELVHRLFRAFHTIKGSGAMCGLAAVAEFTHHVEALLDQARDGRGPAPADLAGALLASADHIRGLLAADRASDASGQAAGERLVARIAALSRNHAPSLPEWTIRFHPDAAYLAHGGNPCLLFRDLRKLGECRIEADTGDVPPLESLAPDRCHLRWTIRLTGAAGESAIRDVFLFADGETILEPAAEPDCRVTAPVAAPSGQASLDKVLARESTVRVPAARLDRLVNLLGELVMNQSRLSQAAAHAGCAELANPVQEIERLIGALRDDVLGIRMLPVGSIFGRFRRVVHDLATELGKQADLVTEGGETELDKSILDQLGEPLVHLLRNALDHGIETPEERTAHGKPPRATVRLAAEHTGSAVVLRIDDDGRGIDTAAVRARAIERQLLAPDATLTDKDVINLVFAAGFSTAREVTSVSGRGVGMDAVKRQIEALRGSVAIASEEGRGCRVTLTLPLTLAIIEGLVVQAGDDRYIVPMAAITENVELRRADRDRNNGRNAVPVRGELVPYIDLREAFAIPGEAPPVEKVVIVRHDDQRVGLVVDRVLGTHQTVIQSLGRFLRKVSVVSGATIMGDGRVALILDVTAVVRFAGRDSGSALAA